MPKESKEKWVTPTQKEMGEKKAEMTKEEREKYLEKVKEEAGAPPEIQQLRKVVRNIEKTRASGEYQKKYEEMRERYREKGVDLYNEIYDIDLKMAMDDILLEPKYPENLKWWLTGEYWYIGHGLADGRYGGVELSADRIADFALGPTTERIYPKELRDVDFTDMNMKALEDKLKEFEDKEEKDLTDRFVILGIHARRFTEALKEKGLIEEEEGE